MWGRMNEMSKVKQAFYMPYLEDIRVQSNHVVMVTSSRLDLTPMCVLAVMMVSVYAGGQTT